jgi:hypothetical protein
MISFEQSALSIQPSVKSIYREGRRGRRGTKENAKNETRKYFGNFQLLDF